VTSKDRIFKSYWWRTNDVKSVILLLTTMVLGLLLLASAGGAVAGKMGLIHYFFLRRQITFLLIGFTIMILMTQFSENLIKLFIQLGFFTTIILLILTPFFGPATKGAKRWIEVSGLSLQPSEFLKPFYTGILALILSRLNGVINLKSFLLCMSIHAFIVTSLLIQPDFGMVITNTFVMFSMFFIAGLKISFILLLTCFFAIFVYLCYLSFPHVAKRIDGFYSPVDARNYQVSKSISSYLDGGLFGKGPGEGTIKYVLPDVHTDFIFAVAAEEFGTVFCLILMCCFGCFILRGFFNLSKQRNLFNIFIGFGILMHFSLQFIFNIGTTLNLLPTKGMTLPFISYGGSSILAFSIAAGIFLNTSKTIVTNKNAKGLFLFVTAY
jgi:cell division protein FtsW